MAYPTCKYRAVARVVMVGVLGGWDCTCSFVLALVCCVSGYIDSSSISGWLSSGWKWRGRPML